MSERLPLPAIYMVNGCVIDLQEVATVIYYLEPGAQTSLCKVILKSGASFNIDMQYSRSLIQAVEWSRSPGSVARPKDDLLDQGKLVDNSWSTN